MLKQLRPQSHNDYKELPILGSLLDDFCSWSRKRGYTVGTIKNQLKDSRHIVNFFCQQGIKKVETVSQSDFENAWQRFRHEKPSVAGTVRQLEKFFLEKYVLEPPSPRPLTSSGKILNLYATYLNDVRGFSASTIYSHLHYIERFLDSLSYNSNDTVLQDLQHNQIDAFLVDCSRTLNRYSLQHVVAYLRGFFRYCYSQKILSVSFHERIDSPRTYRLEKLPRSLPWNIVENLLSSIDRSDSQGKRNYAMLLMAATYGMRSIDIVMLSLDDIDWRNESFSTPQQKTGTRLVQPLTDRVTNALIDYLQNSRPSLSLREVFLRYRAPHGRLKPTAVAEAFQREVRLSGLNIPFQGPHCLRHSLAVHLLRRGAGMKAIGDFLGHRHSDSTSVYLRLSIEDLRSVTLDTPTVPNKKREFHSIDISGLPKVKLHQPVVPGPLKSFLADDLASYIELHRSLGKDYQREESVLRHFDAFMFSSLNSVTEMNNFAFDTWCQSFGHILLSDRRNRMRIIRNFCIYRRRMQPDAFIPDILTFPANCQAKRAFILSQDDIANLLYATRQLPPSLNGPLRPEAMRIAILLLYTCGLRRSELRNLRLADYDHSQITLFIRATKFHKQRIIPLSSTVGEELDAYLCYCRYNGVKMNSGSPIICSYPSHKKGWQAYTGTGLRQNWRYLCAGLGILTPRGIPPRIHDLRHSFAVNSLLHLYRSGQNIQSKLPFLSTYMGHACIASTHYYLSFVEPLQSAVSNRFEQAFGDLGNTSPIQPERQEKFDK